MARTVPFLRLLAVVASLLGLAACGGGSTNSGPFGTIGNPNTFSAVCDPGTQVQLASPTPGQTGVSSNIGSIIVVANGNANTLYNTYQSWNVILQDNFGNTVTGGPLSLVPFNSGPHPYGSDFYYSSSIPSLAPGRNWNVGLVQSFSNCSPYSLFGFST